MTGAHGSSGRRGEQGVSLIETVISMTLFLFILIAVMTTYQPNREIQRSGERRVDVQQNARLALADMARDIRTAGYFPENFASPPANPQLTTPIRMATEGTLAVYGDTDGSGVSTVLLYCLSDGLLLRVRDAVDDAASYTCDGGQVLAEGAADLQFRFYDEEGNLVPAGGPPFELDGQDPGAVPDMSTTTERDAVRKVVITLVMRDELPRRGEYFYTLTSEVVLRNVI